MNGTEYLRGLGYAGMLEGKCYQRLDKVLSVAAPFIDLSMKYAKTSPMLKVHLHYSEIIPVVIGKMGQRAWSEEDLEGLKRIWKE